MQPGRRGAWRPALAAVPVLVAAAALACAAYRGKLSPRMLTSGHPERRVATARNRPFSLRRG
jgi:hypothetical protein